LISRRAATEGGKVRWTHCLMGQVDTLPESGVRQPAMHASSPAVCAGVEVMEDVQVLNCEDGVDSVAESRESSSPSSSFSPALLLLTPPPAWPPPPPWPPTSPCPLTPSLLSNGTAPPALDGKGVEGGGGGRGGAAGTVCEGVDVAACPPLSVVVSCPPALFLLLWRRLPSPDTLLPVLLLLDRLPPPPPPII
jgi:hypothetical protein